MSRTARRLGVLPAWLCGWSLGIGSCSYDLAELERAAHVADGGTADGEAEIPKELIDLFTNLPAVDGDCQRCATNRCAEANLACHDDLECERATACLARARNPRDHAECRELHRDWFVEHVAELDVGGPFYDCVFWRECRSQCGADEDLDCVGGYRWGQVQSGSELALSLRLQEALTSTPVTGATTKVCRLEDIDCDAPSMTAKANEDGRIDVRLPAALGQFTGYLEITGAGLAPTLLVLGWPVANDDAMRVPIVSKATLQLQERVGGRQPAPGTGMVQVRVRGCSGVGTRGVRVDVDPVHAETATWYFDDQVPTFDAKSTFSNGNAGLVNVPEGLANIRGTTPREGEVLRWKVPVRSGHLTVLIGTPLDR